MAAYLILGAAARIGMTDHEPIAAAKTEVKWSTVSEAASADRGMRFDAVAPGLTPLLKSSVCRLPGTCGLSTHGMRSRHTADS